MKQIVRQLDILQEALGWMGKVQRYLAQNCYV